MTLDRHASFYTISDRRFFTGTVALLNSLRLTGNAGEIVVLDQGLTADQSDLLGRHAKVIQLPRADLGHPWLAKAFPHILDAERTIVLIDSDMIVTSSLADILSLAEEGKICVFPNHHLNRNRWFEEWQTIFALPTVPRRQTYFNSGFLCFSTHHWPDLLRLYWEACRKIPSRDIGTREPGDPIFEPDQDAMNALLMSVVPRAAIEELPASAEAYRDELVRVRIIDEQSLACTLDGQPTTILHYTRGPKAWEPRGWWRIRRDAFSQLMPRVLFAEDVPMKLIPDAVPFWLRPSRRASVCLRTIDLAHRLTAHLWRRARAMWRTH